MMEMVLDGREIGYGQIRALSSDMKRLRKDNPQRALFENHCN